MTSVYEPTKVSLVGIIVALNNKLSASIPRSYIIQADSPFWVY